MTQLKRVASLLNLIAFCAFQSEQKRSKFGEFFLDNLRDALSSLVSRDNRIKLFEPGFWVIDKSMAGRTADVSVH